MGSVRKVPAEARAELSRLLDERSASDAMAAYYALRHPAEKVSLYAYQPTKTGLTGLLAVAHTGLDLFRPLAVPFVAHERALTALLKAALKPGRPVLLQVPVEQREWAASLVDLTDVRVAELLRLDLREYEPVVNVLVVEAQAPGGWPRYEIRSGASVYVAAGLNWKGPTFAEVYLEIDPPARGRGYGKSVLAAISGRLLGEGIVALVRINEEDREGRAAAEELGFRPTGIRTLTAHAILKEQPQAQPARSPS